MAESWTVVRLLQTTADYLAGKGVDNARGDAERLLGRVLALDRVGLYLNFDRPVDGRELQAFRELVRRRAGREPLQYILGSTGFWTLEFEVTPEVLIPRADTEVLIEEALRLCRDVRCVLDVGTGSGAIAVTLAHELPQAQVTGLDLSPAALAVARRNAERNGVANRLNWLEGDLAALPAGPWDLMVSNPPYVTAADWAGLEPEVRDHEPRLALVGGADGLDAYRALCRQAPQVLAPGGWLLVEVGIGQAGAVEELMVAAGLTVTFRRADYAAIERVVGGRRPLSNVATNA